MNEQQIDALPPVQPAPSDNQTTGGGVGSSPVPLPVPPQQGQLVDPGAALPPVAPPADTSQATQPLPPMPNAPQPQVGQAAASSVGTPVMADDVDLIEKEWVAKAKQIVENTKQDPYQQNQAMTEVKADYLKKRYNRDLKSGQQPGEA